MYNLTDLQIRKIANLCKQEQGSWQGAAAEATLASNILRTSHYKSKFGNNIYSFMRNSGWFYNAPYYMDNGDADNEYIRIVKDVLVNGNFTLPLGVNEHDCFRDILWARNGDIYIDKKDRSAYIPNVTRIRNVMGAEYTFYCFPAPGSDPFGYTDANRKYMEVVMPKLATIMSLAQTWIGRNEADNSHREIINIYNSQSILPRGYKVQYNDKWCATFISALFIANGCNEFSECGCQEMIEKMKSLGYWKGKTTPRPGDIVFYDWNGDNIADHVGIVENYNSGTNTVIEGNYKDAVGRRTISASASQIIGYARPNYLKGEDEMVKSKFDFHFETVKKGDINGYVRVLQIFMSAFGYYDGPIDGEFGDGTFKAVNAYQARRIKEGCDIGTEGKPDGVCGGRMWNDLMGV